MTNARKKRNRQRRDDEMRRRVPSISNEGLEFLRRYRARACLRKKKYGSHEEARLAGDLVYALTIHKSAASPQPYRCLFCGYYHIGTHSEITDARLDTAKRLLRKAA